MTRHGKTREDPFSWLKDLNWQQVMQNPDQLQPDIRAYLVAENDYSTQVLADTESLQEQIYLEMRGRIAEVDASVPDPDGPFEYYVRYRQGGQQPFLCRRPVGAQTDEQLLLDGDQRSSGQDYFDIGDSGHSPDHRLFAWTEDLNGSERYSLRILTIDSAEMLTDHLEHCQGGFEWANDNTSLFYTRIDEQHRPRWVYRHQLGTDQQSDVLVYTEPDLGFFLAVSKSQDGRYIFIEAHDHITSEVHILDADNPHGQPRRVTPRTTGIKYSLDIHDQQLYILDNADGAEYFKISVADVQHTSRSRWQNFIPHQPGTLICAVEIYKDYLVRLQRRNALPEIIVHRFSDSSEYAIHFDEPAFALSLEGRLEYDTRKLRFRYSSMTTPDQIYDFDMQTQQRILRKSRQIPTGHRPQDYCTERIFAKARDGNNIPVSLLYRRDTPVDGSAPILLYGYGAYGLSLPAAFSSTRLSLVDRGFVYAIAHVRGGMECGYRWYQQGKLADKHHSFEDFIDVAQTLIDQQRGHPQQIFAQGASAGGLLMGAVANLRPDLFAAIIAEVPFVDVLNTMCDSTLPLTPPEWPEWGNPLEDANAYDWIADYSPYENVTEQHYPHMLVTAGLSDPRVTYWEPAKWVARLRMLKTDSHWLLLKTNLQAGHGGASGRFEQLKEDALNVAFIMKVLNVIPDSPRKHSAVP